MALCILKLKSAHKKAQLFYTFSYYRKLKNFHLLYMCFSFLQFVIQTYEVLNIYVQCLVFFHQSLILTNRD